MSKPQIKVTECCPMNAVLLMVEDVNGVEQVFIRLWGSLGENENGEDEEGCMLIQKNPGGELCRLLTKEEVSVYDPALYESLQELTKEKPGMTAKDIENYARERKLQEIIAEALGIDPDDLEMRVAE